MKSTTLKTLLFGLFLVAAVGVKAQEASGGYEYARVFVQPNGTTEPKVYVVYSEKRNKEIIATGLKYTDFVEVKEFILRVVGDKVNNGWSVVTFDEGTCYLKRKKQ